MEKDVTNKETGEPESTEAEQALEKQSMDTSELQMNVSAPSSADDKADAATRNDDEQKLAEQKLAGDVKSSKSPGNIADPSSRRGSGDASTSSSADQKSVDLGKESKEKPNPSQLLKLAIREKNEFGSTPLGSPVTPDSAGPSTMDFERAGTPEASRSRSGSKTEKPKRRPSDFPASPQTVMSERRQLALLKQEARSTEKAQSPDIPARDRPNTPSGSSTSSSKEGRDIRSANRVNGKGETPLHVACRKGDMPSIRKLLDDGADVNAVDFAGWTPLHEAANHGREDVTKILVKHKADVQAKGGPKGITPLMDAVLNNHIGIVRFLLRVGADPKIEDNDGKNCFVFGEKNDEVLSILKNFQESAEKSEKSSGFLSSQSPKNLPSNIKSEIHPVNPFIYSSSSPLQQEPDKHSEDLHSTVGTFPLSPSSFSAGLPKPNVSVTKRESQYEDISDDDEPKQTTAPLPAIVSVSSAAVSPIPVTTSSSAFSSVPPVTTSASESSPSIIPSLTNEVPSAVNEVLPSSSSALPESNANAIAKQFSSVVSPMLSGPNIPTASVSTVPVIKEEIPVLKIKIPPPVPTEPKPQIPEPPTSSVAAEPTPVINTPISTGSTKISAASLSAETTSSVKPSLEIVPKPPLSVVPVTTKHLDVVPKRPSFPPVGPVPVPQPQTVPTASPVGDKQDKLAAPVPSTAAAFTAPGFPDVPIIPSIPYTQSVAVSRPSPAKTSPVTPKIPPLTLTMPSALPIPSISLGSASDNQPEPVKQGEKRLAGEKKAEKPPPIKLTAPPDRLLLSYKKPPKKDIATAEFSGGEGLKSGIPNEPEMKPQPGELILTVRKKDDVAGRTPMTRRRAQAQSNPTASTSGPKRRGGREDRPVRGRGKRAAAVAAAQATMEQSDLDQQMAIEEPRQKRAKPVGKRLKSPKEELLPPKLIVEPPSEPVCPSPAPLPFKKRLTIRNEIEEFINQRRQVEENWRNYTNNFPMKVFPKNCSEYLIMRKNYSTDSAMPKKRDAPLVLAPELKTFFSEQEEERRSLMRKHIMERDQLIMGAEQEMMRLHQRFCRISAGITVPYSACMVISEQDSNRSFQSQEQDDRARSATRSRISMRDLIKWLEDSDDKFDYAKKEMLTRHRLEASMLRSKQRLDWAWKMDDLGMVDPSHKNPEEADNPYVLEVVVEDFVMLPDQ